MLADSLLRASNSAKYRRAIMDKNLVLVSPFNPEAGFDVGNAMARNKYIYALSDAAVIVSAIEGKGGTWSGAVEALKHAWVPLWVKAHSDAQSGNAVLVSMGANWLEQGAAIDTLVLGDKAIQGQSVIASDTKTQKTVPDSQARTQASQHIFEPFQPWPALTEEVTSEPVAVIAGDEAATHAVVAMSLYEHFLLKLADETASGPLTAEALQDKLELHKSQLADWLKCGITDGRVEKLNKPVRYQWVRTLQTSLL